MSKNLFGVQSVRVFKQNKVEQFNCFQRFVLWMIRVKFPEKYSVTFSITLYKSNFLPINSVINLGNEASPLFLVIAQDIRERDMYRISPNKFLTMQEIKHIITQDCGFIWASTFEEKQFVRNKPIDKLTT